MFTLLKIFVLFVFCVSQSKSLPLSDEPQVVESSDNGPIIHDELIVDGTDAELKREKRTFDIGGELFVD